MSVLNFTLRQLLEAGAHFGHHPRRWNPKMSPYIFGTRAGVHILDLQQTAPMLKKALTFVKDVASNGGRVLFVGTKRQASDIVAEAAQRCGQYFVNHRWLGGMITNWKTVSQSIRRLKEMDKTLEEGVKGLTKKELLNFQRKRDKLNLFLGGIRDLGGKPDAVFVMDTVKEQTAVLEARKAGIPVIGLCDSNADPDLIDYVIPGNDDARRSIELFANLMAGAVLEGIEKQMMKSGVDLGVMENAKGDVAAEAPAADNAQTEEQANTQV